MVSSFIFIFGETFDEASYTGSLRDVGVGGLDATWLHEPCVRRSCGMLCYFSLALFETTIR